MRQMKDSNSDWLGLIPADWIVDRLGVIANRFYRGIGITRDDVDLDGDTPCVRYGDIYTKYNISFSSCSSRTNKEKLSATIFAEYGDVLFALTGEKVEEIGKSIVCLSEEPCLVGGDIAIMKHTQNPSYMGYLLSSDFAQQQKSSGKAKLKVVHTHIKDLRNIIIPIPPLSEQRAIADYLDVKCGEVDALVSLQEEMISELQAYKHAVITEAVTHGLNPNAKMKDSNVQWIGSVPEHWDRCKVKYIGNIKSGDSLRTESQDAEGQYEVWGGNGLTGHHSTFNEKGNSIIIGRVGALCGNVRLCSYPIFVTDNALILSITATINRSYLYYSLKARNLNELNESNAQPLITGTKVLNTYIPKPPLSEQQQIAAYLDTKCTDIDALIGLKQQKIEELKEWKKSLIFECVTGKREIQQA